jgi:hypothetical protein
MIIGLIGFIGSGKDSVGTLLNSHGFGLDSFARSLKEAVSIIFGWDINLLEGTTKESREWRDKIDHGWSQLMGREITPRMILQEFGTEICQGNISKQVWVESLFRRSHVGDLVITDTRFAHEARAIKERGGFLVRVVRYADPWWFNILETLQGDERDFFMAQFPDIHRSEWDWVGEEVDFTINNSGTLEDLKSGVSDMLKILKERL